MIQATDILTAVVAALGVAGGLTIVGGLAATALSYLDLRKARRRLVVGLMDLERFGPELPWREPYGALPFLLESEVGQVSVAALVAYPGLEAKLLHAVRRGAPPSRFEGR